MGACCSAAAAADGSASASRRGGGSRKGGAQSSMAPLQHSHLDPGLADTHEYMGRLGRGGTGEICAFRDVRNGQQVAIKLIRRPLPRIVATNLLREILIQAELGEGHCNIIQAREVMLTAEHLCLVMELAAGGTLMAHVSERHSRSRPGSATPGLSEDEARYYFSQFIDAVSYCHDNNVAHRDLKLDNTLLDGSRPPRVKLCDFGFAKDFEPGQNMMTNIGTPTYMSPAQLHRHPAKAGYVGTAVDVWAAGVLLSVMLLGCFPFDHVDNPDPNSRSAQMEVWAQQVHGRWHDLPAVAAVVNKLSRQVFDLLDRIFVVDEEQRITIKQIREHPWFTQPPAPAFSAAMVQLALEQRQLEGRSRTQVVDETKKAARAARIEDLIAQAGLRPPRGGNAPTSPSVRISLRRSAILAGGSNDGTGTLHPTPSGALLPVGEGMKQSKSARSLAEALCSLEQAEAEAAMEAQQGQNGGKANGQLPSTALPVAARPSPVVNGGTEAA